VSGLQEEKRHKIREPNHTGSDVAMSFDKETSRIEMRLWMKWGATIVVFLLTIVGWFSIDFLNKLRADAADGPKAMALIEPQIKEFEEMKREQKRMSRNIDRMTIFFETKWDMPREARHRVSRDSEDN
jgi:hypothetical protein